MRSCPVSVIVPTFNRSEMVRTAVESVLLQTVRCSELIVVDDGSTDSTAEVVSELQARSGLIKALHQENKGPAAARNSGLQIARFPLIAFLDSDDHWHKKKLEVQYSRMSSSPEYLISHTFERWLRRGRHLNQKLKHIPRHGDIYSHCLELCAVGMSTVMVRKKLFDKIGLFDESLPCCEDYDLWLRTSCRYPFLLVDNALTVKEGGREDQVSSRFRVGMDRFRIYSIRKLLESGVLNWRQQMQALGELRNKCTIFGNGCLKHGQEEKGQEYLQIINDCEKMTVERFPQLRGLLQ